MRLLVLLTALLTAGPLAAEPVDFTTGPRGARPALKRFPTWSSSTRIIATRSWYWVSTSRKSIPSI